MATERDEILPDFDEARHVADDFGLRQFRTIVRTTTWSGARVGEGAPTHADLELSPRARVRNLDTRTIAGSAGRYTEGDFRIDKITPAYPPGAGPYTGGYTPDQVAPPVTARNVEVHYRLIGPGEPAGGSLWTIVGTNFDRNFGYTLVVRRTERMV